MLKILFYIIMNWELISFLFGKLYHSIGALFHFKNTELFHNELTYPQNWEFMSFVI